MTRFLALLFVALWVPGIAFAAEPPQTAPVRCEGLYPHHLQGVAADDEHLYWCFTTTLVKTDRQGKLVAKIPVANHHGDLCHVAGHIYVAVNLGKFNDPAGNADSWIYVYRARDLEFVAKHPATEVTYGAGGIGFRDGHFFVVGGLPDGVEKNLIYEYDGRMQFVRRHELASGWTQLGIQTATFAQGRWWFGCYGDPKILLTAAADFSDVRRFEQDASLGLVPLGKGKFLVARGTSKKGIGCTARLVPANGNLEHGLELKP